MQPVWNVGKRKFDNESDAILWITGLAKDFAEDFENLRIGYHDDSASLKRFSELKQEGDYLHNYGMEQTVKIEGRLADIGVNLSGFERKH